MAKGPCFSCNSLESVSLETVNRSWFVLTGSSSFSPPQPAFLPNCWPPRLTETSGLTPDAEVTELCGFLHQLPNWTRSNPYTEFLPYCAHSVLFLLSNPTVEDYSSHVKGPEDGMIRSQKASQERWHLSCCWKDEEVVKWMGKEGEILEDSWLKPSNWRANRSSAFLSSLWVQSIERKWASIWS